MRSRNKELKEKLSRQEYCKVDIVVEGEELTANAEGDLNAIIASITNVMKSQLLKPVEQAETTEELETLAVYLKGIQKYVGKRLSDVEDAINRKYMSPEIDSETDVYQEALDLLFPNRNKEDK